MTKPLAGRRPRVRPFRILLPLGGPRAARDLVRLAAALGSPSRTEVTALGVVEVPSGDPLSDATLEARATRRRLQRVIAHGDAAGVAVRTMARIGRSAADGVMAAVEEVAPDLLLLGWDGPARGGADAGATVFSTTIDPLVRDAPCHVAVVRLRRSPQVRSILVPVRGGPHAELAMRLARGLAAHHGAPLVVLHIVPTGIGERACRREQAALDRFVTEHGGRRATGLLRESSSVRAAILREARQHDLVLMGASAQPSNAAPDGRFLFGTVADTVAASARSTVIVVKTGQPPGLSTFEQLRADEQSLAAADAEVERDRSLPAVVDRWFAENTFHAGEFRDIARLLELKQRQGLTISVGLPALNEERTIGQVIRRIQGPLMEKVPLVDQLVVIDSDSTDRTREIAAELGVPVVRHRDILPELGSWSGKGEALWKSLHVLDGEIVAWVDTDIRNIQPRFVYGLLGPLLREQRIGYVKGFYQRPLRSGGALVPDEGGRVTELMARPLINLFFPELSGIIQPLSGEYAGRRSLLESVPFFTGYGVEIGLLIDILEEAGLAAIGQVDLERRVHRNQPLTSLSQMSFTILQAAIGKLEERHRLELLSEVGRGMKVIGRDGERFNLQVREVADGVRPPMRTIAAYLERRRGLRTPA